MVINGAKFPLVRSHGTQQAPIENQAQPQESANPPVNQTPPPSPDPASLAARELEEQHFNQLRGRGVQERLGLTEPSSPESRIRSTLAEGVGLSSKELSKRLTTLYYEEFSGSLRAKDFCSELRKTHDPEQTTLSASQFEALTELVRTEIAIEYLQQEYPGLRSETSV